MSAPSNSMRTSIFVLKF